MGGILQVDTIQNNNATTLITQTNVTTITFGATSQTISVPSVASFATTIGVGGATPSSSGAGITFPASASASSNANTLDDYEEGTWSPTLTATTSASGQTYSDQTGRYTKIGRYVFCTVDLRLTAKGTLTGDVLIGNLPFTSTSAQGAGGPVVYWTALGASWTNINVFVIPSTTTAYLLGAKTAVADAIFFATADVTNTTTFRINISYTI
jgi:hypothetical protein